tara:strand:+ start:1603 stop:1770 length:168 start_codon:yes stop_codon:yes gene_type:complete
MIANLIPHGNFPGLTPTGQVVALAVAILFGGVIAGIWFTFGPGNKNLEDPWDHDD